MTKSGLNQYDGRDIRHARLFSGAMGIVGCRWKRGRFDLSASGLLRHGKVTLLNVGAEYVRGGTEHFRAEPFEGDPHEI
jgi:hypothetical protein